MYSLTLQNAGVLAAALTMAVGCGQSDDLDLSSLPIAIEDRTDDVPGGSPYTWTRPSASQVNCIRAPCPSHMIHDANTGDVELVYAFDWRALRLSDSEQQKLESLSSTTLLYGRYVPGRAFGEQVLVYQVTRANLPVADRSKDSPESDRYYSVRAPGPSCMQPPCPVLWATALNLPPNGQGEQWTGVDLSPLGLSQQDSQDLLADLKAGKAYVSTSNPSVMPVPIDQAFRPYANRTNP